MPDWMYETGNSNRDGDNSALERRNSIGMNNNDSSTSLSQAEAMNRNNSNERLPPRQASSKQINVNQKFIPRKSMRTPTPDTNI